MTNIAVANYKHQRLSKGVFIGEAHGSRRLECINAHCWILSKDCKNILLQKRSISEPFFGGKLDISLAGHVDEGEDPKSAIIREAEEEGHIDISKYIVRRPRKIIFSENGNFLGHDFVHNQQAYVFYIRLTKETIDSIVPDNKEVDSFKLVNVNEFRRMIESDNDQIVRHPKDYFRIVLNDIDKIIENSKLN